MRNFTRYQGPAIPEAQRSAIRPAEVNIGLALSGIRGIECGNRILRALVDCPGVVDAELDPGGAYAEVWYRPDLVGPTGLRKVVLKAGDGTHHRYQAVPVKPLFPRPVRRESEIEDTQVAGVTVRGGYHPDRIFRRVR